MNPAIFADVFYAVVLGFALSIVKPDGDLLYYAYLVTIFLPVLEDWYTYYKVVKPAIVNVQDYNFHSLMVEFLILLFWSLSFRAINDKNMIYLLFFCLFMAIRWYAGFWNYLRRRKVLAALREMLYAVSSFASFVLYIVFNMQLVAATTCVFVNFIVWLGSIVVWWIFKRDHSRVQE